MKVRTSLDKHPAPWMAQGCGDTIILTDGNDVTLLEFADDGSESRAGGIFDALDRVAQLANEQAGWDKAE